MIPQITNPLSTETNLFNYLEKYCSPEEIAVRSLQRTNAKIKLIGHRNIVLVLNVLGDGFGDLTNGRYAYWLIKEAYPNWTLRILILLHHERLPMSLKEWGLNEEECLIIRSRHKIAEPPFDESVLFRYKINLIYNKEKDTELRSKLPVIAKKIDDFMDFFKKADLQIMVSAPSDVIAGGINTLSPKFMYFAEYGGEPWRLAKSFCMGVKPNSCGIYILNPAVPEQFSNPMLKKYYEEKGNIYFSYGGNNSGDIQEYVSLLNHLNPEAKELNIVSNLSYDKIQGMMSTLHKEGIKNIVSINKEDCEVKISESDSPGKLLRFINPFPLSQGDMMRAMKKSAEPVGVTGNSTFSEILALGQLPFYHMRHCIFPFWNQLIYLAKNATPDSKELIQYLEHMLCEIVKDHPEDRYKNFEKPNISVLKKQWAELVAILRRDWDVKEAYLGEINRQILAQENS